jgi:hypothetical protein
MKFPSGWDLYISFADSWISHEPCWTPVRHEVRLARSVSRQNALWVHSLALVTLPPHFYYAARINNLGSWAFKFLGDLRAGGTQVRDLEGTIQQRTEVSIGGERVQMLRAELRVLEFHSVVTSSELIAFGCKCPVYYPKIAGFLDRVHRPKF